MKKKRRNNIRFTVHDSMFLCRDLSIVLSTIFQSTHNTLKGHYSTSAAPVTFLSSELIRIILKIVDAYLELQLGLSVKVTVTN